MVLQVLLQASAIHVYSAKKFCTDGFSGKSCLGQELLHLMLYIVVYRNNFATT